MAKKKIQTNQKQNSLKHNSNGFQNYYNPFIQGYGTFNGRIVNQELLERLKNLDTYISLNRPLLDFLFLKVPLVEKIIKLAPTEALSKKLIFHSWQYSQEELDILAHGYEETNAHKILLEALWKARLYGGSAIIIDILPQGYEFGTVEGRQAMDARWIEPLTNEEVSEAAGLDFQAADLWELSLLSTTFGTASNPQKFNLDAKETYFYYYGKKIHRSRLIIFRGESAPSLYAPIYRGWGKSLLEGVLEPLRAYILILTLSLELANEKKIDVFKIDGLIDGIMAGQERNIKAQMDFIQYVKDFTGSLTIDKLKHEFEQRQLSVGDVREIADLLMEQIPASTYYPYQKIFGSAPNRPGFGGHPNQSQENADYLLYLKTIQNDSVYYIKTIYNYLSLFYLNEPIENLTIMFENLYTPPPEQEEARKTGECNRLITLKSAFPEIISDEMVRKIINEGELLPIQLDEISSLPLEGDKKKNIFDRLFGR
jgi:hypothetical protein